MAKVDKIPLRPRTERGTTQCRRLRAQGQIPCNVYGHKQDPVMLTAAIDALKPVTLGHRIVMLEVNGSSEQALVKSVQYDGLGSDLLHVDFVRIDATERMRVKVPIHLKGTPPGVIAGGIVEQPLRELEVECVASDLPEFIDVKIGHLELNASIHVSDLTDLPPGITILNHPESVVVHIGMAMIEEIAPAVPAGTEAAEPELIRKERETETDEE
jgi:large subunit ribosomal protein L25